MKTLEELVMSMADETFKGISVIRDISPKEKMFIGDEEHYFGVGHSALECIRLALQAIKTSPEGIRRILDLPCGHGRVLRYLRAAFPGSEITACDLLSDGVDYCVSTFGAIPVYSDVRPERIPLRDNSFDLIWVGSLLTHLDRDLWTEFLALFRRVLSPGGVLIFSTHGREAYDRAIRKTFNYHLPYWRETALFRSYERSGFGYADYLPSPGHGIPGSYGVSLAHPSWVFEQIAKTSEMRVAYFSERAWDGFHDVYACIRDPGWRVIHPPTPTLRFLKHRVRERLRPRVH